MTGESRHHAGPVTERGASLRNLVALARPRDMTKNLFVFLPLFFGLRLGEIGLLGRAAVAFLAYSLAAVCVYVFNDLRDVESDRRHPRKRHRPLARGAVSRRTAILILTLSGVLGFGLMAFLDREALGVLALYVLLNTGYSLGLKHVPILDVTIVAVGFVLRILVGGLVTEVPLSAWIVVMTFLLALFLALAKRRDDVLLHLRTGETTRRSIHGYNLPFLDSAMAIMAGVVIVAYVSYALSPEVARRLGTENFYFTTFFVVLGILRYLQIVFVEENSGSPTDVVLSDRFLQGVLLGWILTSLWVIYR